MAVFLIFTLFGLSNASQRSLNDAMGLMGTTQEIYDQTLDHFNAYNQATFKQRWFWNDSFWTGSSKLGPLIFQAGGEGQNNGGIYGFVEDFAQEIGALVLTAEHRFYGESRPFGTGSNSANNYKPNSDTLGLLQVEQAMADYLELMTFWKSSAKWNCPLCPTIVVGGSYPGELSVWLRMKYPHMFDMALGASAPIFYTSNSLVPSEKYYEIVTNAVNKISPKCKQYVQAAYSALMTSTDAEVTKGIPICAPYLGIDELQALLYEDWANYAMGNYPPLTSPMKSACERIENGSITDGLEIWQRFFQPSLNKNGCLNMTRSIPEGVGGTIHCSDLTGCGSGYDGESWDYQACSQNIEPFSTNNETDMFPVYEWSMDWLDHHCLSRFNIKASTRDTWMETEFGLKAEYFMNRFPEITSRIIFSNGEQDGWSAGGVLKNMSDTLIAIVIPNGAHHSDMRGSSPDDTQDIKDARIQEKNILTQWVKEIQQQYMK